MRSHGQHHVVFANVARTGMQDVDFDVFTDELVERIDDRFNRALTIGLDDKRQFFDLASLNLRVKVVERQWRTGAPAEAASCAAPMRSAAMVWQPFRS